MHHTPLWRAVRHQDAPVRQVRRVFQSAAGADPRRDAMRAFVLARMLNDLTVAASYRLREHQEKAPLYRQLFEIEAEERSQRTECWRDIANVMRDFLGVWEAHEQARPRAIFLTDVGTGTS